MRKSFLLAAAFAAAAFASAPAQAADILTALTSQRLTAMLQAAGATQIATEKPQDGVEIVTFNDGNGGVNLILLDCQAGSCPTLQMSVAFEKDAKYTLTALNGYNATYLNAQAAVLPNGNVVLARLYSTLGGVTEDNLKANLAIFLQAPTVFENHINAQVTAAVDTKGAPAPVAATTDIRSLLKLGFEQQAPRKFDLAKWLSETKNIRKAK